ncbi:MAG TPA: RNA methyltransferase [Steroidobacteraceae bacterium]|nr:RNA methyltransferase [Steroidobacteraceae bacterium]
MTVPVRIVLVATSHPGNIGAAARAMKNMGLDDLALVRPESFPNAAATARASGAAELLHAAQVHERLEDAIGDCGLVVGTSARQRHLHWPLYEPREAATHVLSAAATNPVAIVFGSERAGLTNEELALCNVLITIPTASEYASLNVAAAVQIVAYELWLARRPGSPPPPERDVPLASMLEVERFYAHLEQVLEQIDFRDRTGGGHLMARIRRLFNRVAMDQNEINILRGILTAVQGRRRPAGIRQVNEGGE